MSEPTIVVAFRLPESKVKLLKKRDPSLSSSMNARSIVFNELEKSSPKLAVKSTTKKHTA